MKLKKLFNSYSFFFKIMSLKEYTLSMKYNHIKYKKMDKKEILFPVEELGLPDTYKNLGK